MTVAWYLLWFIIAVGLLVTVHEFGHFWVARRLGFKVLRFSVGFGKPLLKRVSPVDGTEYVLAAVPLGGYVKLLDEREAPVEPADLPRSFTRRPHWQRIAVLLAGPLFNLVFAVALLWGMLWVSGVTELRPKVGQVTLDSLAAKAGLRPGDEIRTLDGAPVVGQRDVVFGLLDAMSSAGNVSLGVRGGDGEARTVTISVASPEERRHLTEPAELFRGIGFQFWQPSGPAVLAKVLPEGPAARAGLMAGDRIIAINGVTIRDFQDLLDYINARPGERISIDYRRGDSTRAATLVVANDEEGGRHIGRIRVEGQVPKYPDSMLLHSDLGPLAALGRAGAEAWSLTVFQARLFWRMVIGRVSIKNLSGPLSIAEFAGESAHAGAASFLSTLVLLSLSLGFLNLLPIPILDGGQIVFQLVEWLKGSPLSERAQVFGQQVGIALLIVLMGVALYNDIARQFS
jgi:regulator of sigma E protease